MASSSSVGLLADSFHRHVSASEKSKIIQSLVDELESSEIGSIDLLSVQLCVSLLHLCPDVSAFERITRLFSQEIECGGVTTERLCAIAHVSLSNPELDSRILQRMETVLNVTLSSLEFQTPIREFLDQYLPDLQAPSQAVLATQDGESSSANAVSCTNWLRCYFWMVSKDQTVSIKIVSSLLALLGGDNELVISCYETLLAFMTAVQGKGLRVHEQGQLMGEQFWHRICDLLHDLGASKSAAATFKLWFSWLHQGSLYGPSQESLKTDRYWSMIQSGLLLGSSEQRKFCLGIVRRSLTLLRSDLFTEHLQFLCTQKRSYETQYEKYCKLFETIVLDHYPNQVEASLEELSRCLKKSSLIHISWMNTLLSAVLSDRVPPGIRKIVGTWYMDFTLASDSALLDQQDFLLQGFLPWATQGMLFLTTFETSRSSSSCNHGVKLSKVIQLFVQSPSNISEKIALSRRILAFLVENNATGFVYSTLYVLEGLLDGLTDSKMLDSFGVTELELVVKISRPPHMPEVARDLCTSYCMAFFGHTPADVCLLVPGYNSLKARWDETLSVTSDQGKLQFSASQRTLRECISGKQRKQLQGDGLRRACNDYLRLLDSSDMEQYPPRSLFSWLDAIWDEANVQEYPKAVLKKLPAIFFHSVCIEMYQKHLDHGDTIAAEALATLLRQVLKDLYQISEGRTWALSPLFASVRRMCFLHPSVFDLLPIEDILVRFTNHPPLPRIDFLFEAVAVEKLQAYVAHKDYFFYYGNREFHAYACVVDLVNRIPTNIAKRLLHRLLHPWQSQMAPIPIISKWKNSLQLQIILILVESCISKGDALETAHYLKTFMDILGKEPWPRLRYLLDWIVARLYLLNPEHRNKLLDDLAKEQDSNPKLIASLIELAVMVTSYPDTTEDFALRLMTLLIPCSASPRIQIRHEAHRSFPIVWDIVRSRGWSNLLDNPAFSALDSHIRSLDRFNDTEHGYRTLNLDPIKQHSIVNIFQGEYMFTDPPERELVAYEDFKSLWDEDESKGLKQLPLARIPLGEKKVSSSAIVAATPARSTTASKEVVMPAPSIPLQTKSSLIPSLLGQPLFRHFSTQRPTTLFLIASLIDNPYNLGGLSRVSEIFGLEGLGIRSLDTMSHKDFLSVSVTSHKHLPIFALQPGRDMVDWCFTKKQEGYQVVCVEQTDRSLVLGEGSGEGQEVMPQKCVLVLGSERQGVSAEILAVADRCVEIRQVGVTRSLNVQTAGAIACFEWQRIWGGRA